MNNQPIEQRLGESRADYVALITSAVELEQVGSGRLAFNAATLNLLQKLVVWFFRHWLLLANLYYALLLLFAFLGPWFYQQGWTAGGAIVFANLNIICDQVPTHSYYPFGFQCGLCQRCLAIYTAMLLGGLYYAWIRRSGGVLRPLPWHWFVIFALPLVIDGFTQLFGWRQSNVVLRTLTGGLFGFAAVAIIYPWFDGARRKFWALWGIDAVRGNSLINGGMIDHEAYVGNLGD